MRYRIIDIGNNTYIAKVNRNNKWETLVVTDIFEDRSKTNLLCLENDFVISPKYHLMFNNIKDVRVALKSYKKNFDIDFGKEDAIMEEDDI